MSQDADQATFAPLPIDLLPWQARASAQLAGAVSGGRLAHGLLLHGPSGVGKERFAAALAAALFCTGRGLRLEACGQCADCALSRAGTHPDLHWVRRLEDKKSIGVDQIREVCEKLAMTSMRRGYRLAIVVPAQSMTPPAQNALLKTLEEPAPRTVIVLVTARPSGLLATLRSRCQRIEVARPEPAAARQWLARALEGGVPERLLALAGGAPLRALELAPHFAALESQMAALLEALLSDRSEVTRLAEDMLGEGLMVRLDWLEDWLGIVIRRRALPDETRLTLPGGALLQRAAAAVNITALFLLVDRLREARRLLDGSAAPQLVAEALLIDIRAAFVR